LPWKVEGIYADEDADVREASLNSLGSINLPWVESLQSDIARRLDDESPVVRAMAAWSIGKIGSSFANRFVVDRLIKLLKDSFWKVKTAACITIGVLGAEFIEMALDTLLDALKTASINRVIVCETIIKMGSDGERILVEILKRMRVKDAKLISPILQSLELADITRPTIDFTFEELFNCISKGTPQIKKVALETLLKLRQRYGDQELPVFFNFSNLQPLLEKSLRDHNAEIRDLCLEFIITYPHKERLFLIDAATDSKDPIIRSEAIRGLSRFGLKYLRIILYGLSDNSELVRK
jgi:HEAT repeat protein